MLGIIILSKLWPEEKTACLAEKALSESGETKKVLMCTTKPIIGIKTGMNEGNAFQTPSFDKNRKLVDKMIRHLISDNPRITALFLGLHDKHVQKHHVNGVEEHRFHTGESYGKVSVIFKHLPESRLFQILEKFRVSNYDNIDIFYQEVSDYYKKIQREGDSETSVFSRTSDERIGDLMHDILEAISNGGVEETNIEEKRKQLLDLIIGSELGNSDCLDHMDYAWPSVELSEKIQMLDKKIRSKKAILIVDDQLSKRTDQLRKDIVELFSDCEYAIAFAGDEKTALSFLNQPESKIETVLILLDIIFKRTGEDGKERGERLGMKYLEIFRSGFPGIPVIMLTQLAPSAGESKSLRRLGAFDYLAKTYLDPKKKGKLDSSYFKNTIISAIESPKNETFNLEINPIKKSLDFVRIDRAQSFTYSFSNTVMREDWQRAKDMPVIESNEIIFRILYEMAKNQKKEIELKDVYILNDLNVQRTRLKNYLFYLRGLGENRQLKNLVEIIDGEPGETRSEIIGLIDQLNEIKSCHNDPMQKKLADQLLKVLKMQKPPQFIKALNRFNDEIRVETKGNIVGRLLYSKGGQGSRSNKFSISINSVSLEPISASANSQAIEGKKSYEERLLKLEEEVREIKNNLSEIINLLKITK